MKRNLDLKDKPNEQYQNEAPETRLTRFKGSVKWSIYAFIAAFCLYRLAAFTPQPLDSPSTLRPILYRLFSWFRARHAQPEEAFGEWSAICFWALLVPATLAALAYASRLSLTKLPKGAAQVLCSRWLFFASIAACLILCRYPTLLENEFNPDEGQFLASAHKLFYNPNFFQAVDCGTSGPINIYPLMLPAIFGFSPDFASSRAIVLAIIMVSAFLLYRSVALIAQEELARIAILPYVGAFAVFKDIELVHYSSEHVPLLLISIALYCSVRVLHQPAKYAAPILVLGVLSCAAFFAKMQSLPIVAALAGVALICVYATGQAGALWRPATVFVAGAMPLMLINIALCVSAGVWTDFWTTYILANISYAGGESRFFANLRAFVRYLLRPAEVRFFLFTVFSIGGAYLVERIWRRITSTSHFPALRIGRPAAADPVRWFGLLSILFITAALFSIHKAQREFLHYLLFLFMPFCAAVAWMLIRQVGTARRLAFPALVIVLTIAYQSHLWSFQDDHVFKNVAHRIRPPEGDFIRSLTDPGGRIFVWGWTVRPYLGSARVSATRDTNVSNCFRSYNLMTSPPALIATQASEEVSAYNERRILHDLRANPPELFIDAIGPTSWFLIDRKYFGFQQFSEIAAFVDTNYIFLAERYEQRYFLRRDLTSRKARKDKDN